VKLVVLVGLMGSGKSTIGQIVATRTGRRLVDLDVAIAGHAVVDADGVAPEEAAADIVVTMVASCTAVA